MPAQDMIVKLWDLPSKEPVLQRLAQQNVTIKRVIAPDRPGFAVRGQTFWRRLDARV